MASRSMDEQSGEIGQVLKHIGNGLADAKRVEELLALATAIHKVDGACQDTVSKRGRRRMQSRNNDSTVQLVRLPDPGKGRAVAQSVGTKKNVEKIPGDDNQLSEKRPFRTRADRDSGFSLFFEKKLFDHVPGW